MSKGPVRPVKVNPRLDQKPWGGRRLEDWGITLPPEATIGEALLTAPEATVASGDHQGTPLGELARQDRHAWIGARGLAATGGRTIFPLLIKLIDGHADLSIQVHPDDRAAAAMGLGTGKTEAYHILAADAGSVIYLGLDEAASEERFAASCLRADASAASCLRQVLAEPGMTVLIPAGTPHALGAGVAIYEIQQPSNVTFRLDDWGRLDASGTARALHHAEGLTLIDPHARPEPISPLPFGDRESGRLLLVATRYFALERIMLAANTITRFPEIDSPQVLTCIEGAAMVEVSGWVSSVATGETLVVPVGGAATLTGRGHGVVMRGWVADLEHEVIAPARAAGVPDDALRELGIGIGFEGAESGAAAGGCVLLT